MSGTSLDGIDVAVIDITGRNAYSTVAFATTPYPAAVRRALEGVSNAVTHTREVARLHFLLGELYAEAVRETCRRAGIPLETVKLIGSHGQTIYHEGEPAAYLGRRVASTLQIGEAAVIAERTGIPVVSDFRPRDIACGGRGAPLVPLVDYLMYAHRRLGRVALNIGGIANITAIPAGARPEQVMAFDTGPGNMVIDGLAAALSGGVIAYDKDGGWAARGKVDEELLRELMQHPFLSRRPPKSTGREEFGAEFVTELLARGAGMAAEDLLATATAFTAETIATAYREFVLPELRRLGTLRSAQGRPCATGQIDEVILGGGGSYNRTLRRRLEERLPGIAVLAHEDFGINGEAKEALAFAILGNETVLGRPANVPSATGARRAVVLGKVVLP